MQSLCQQSTSDDDYWPSVSDLMAGLMVIFLFISIALIRNAYEEKDKIKQLAVAYQQNQVAIYEALYSEFESDLNEWDAVITQDNLTFEFRSPEILFDSGSSRLKDRFKEILDNFFPRYLKVLSQFSESIDEVRIEGHTSSNWNKKTDTDTAYFKNMNLSQGRTQAVLKYIYNIERVASKKQWIKKRFAAVGLSSSHIIKNHDGSENLARSRRVTFRVITNAEIHILKILEK